MDGVNSNVQTQEGEIVEPQETQQTTQEETTQGGIPEGMLEGMEPLPVFSETQTEQPLPEQPVEKGIFLKNLDQRTLLIIGAVLAGVILFAVVFSIMRKKSKAETTELTEHSQQAPAEEEKTDAAATEAVPEAPQTGIRMAVVHNIGARNDQQDSYGIAGNAEESRLIAVVADGMGGLANGKAVSSTLVNVFTERWQYNAQPAQDYLLTSALQANDVINRMLRGAAQSGSTLVAASVTNGALHFLTVGDSHIYLCRGGALLQLNREHVYREELALAAVNRQQPLERMHTDRQAGALTSYFGAGHISHLDRNEQGIKLVAGDKILLMSDGVFGTLSNAEMEQALLQPIEIAARVMDEMIQHKGRQHQDNYTAVILEYLG